MEGNVKLNGFPEKEAEKILQKVKEIGKIVKSTGLFDNLSMTFTNIDKDTEALLLVGVSDKDGDAFQHFPQNRLNSPNEGETPTTTEGV